MLQGMMAQVRSPEVLERLFPQLAEARRAEERRVNGTDAAAAVKVTSDDPYESRYTRMNRGGRG